MLLKLPYKFEPGEIADNTKINENFAYVQSAINGHLDAGNLNRAYRMTYNQAKCIYTPVCYTVILDPDSSQAVTRTRARVQLPASIDGGLGGANTALFDHADFSYLNDGLQAGQLTPIRESDGVRLLVTIAATNVWLTTYDVPVPEQTYVWGGGQQLVSAGTTQSLITSAGGACYVTNSTGNASANCTFLRVRLWFLMPQADVASPSPYVNSLTRNILPPELD